ncbi:hypothetical protein pb186bvf_000384 [Paramecium bursaria]
MIQILNLLIILFQFLIINYQQKIHYTKPREIRQILTHFIQDSHIFQTEQVKLVQFQVLQGINLDSLSYLGLRQLRSWGLNNKQIQALQLLLDQSDQDTILIQQTQIKIQIVQNLSKKWLQQDGLQSKELIYAYLRYKNNQSVKIKQTSFMIFEQVILIDTPGFNDDRDQKKQPNLIEKIFTYLQNDQKIDCICLVLEANIIRLTKEQNSFFEKVIRYFGKDALTNFKFIFTQSLDDNLPQSMQAIKFKGDQQHQESPFAQHYDQIKSPIYFKVNCQNILSHNEIQDLEDYFWKMTYKSIVEFFGEISNLLPVQSSKFAFIEKNKYMDNIQRLLVEICKFKESSLKTKEKQQTQPLKGQSKQGEEQRIKKIVLENRKKFSLQKLVLKEEIQNYCKLSLETFIDYTEVLKDQQNPKDISHKKIMVNIIESLQEDYFMYEAKLPQK